MHRFEEELQKAVEAGRPAGAALLVSRKGEVLFRRVFGFKTLLPEKEPMEEKTLFDIASLTKPVATTTLSLLARHEKKLPLDTTIARRLTELAGGDKEKVTPRHLLKHTSGLPAWRPYFEEIKKDRLEILGKRECSRIYLGKISQEPLDVPVGYQRTYSDLGFILLGILLEEILEGPLDRLFEERVAGPMNLQQTFFLPPERPLMDRKLFAATEDSPWRKRLLRGEVHDDNAYALGGVAGHAGLFSTMDDLHTFLTEIEKGYRGESPLLPQEEIKEFMGPRVKTKLGWDTPEKTNSQAGRFFSTNSIGHLGYTGCSFWADLDQDYHIILLTNHVHPTPQPETLKVLRPLLHDLIYEELIAK